MRSTHERRGLTRLAVLCLPVAATLILPAAAFAATGTSTVIATVNGDGSVKAVKVVAANGSTGNFNGSLPVKVSISRSVSGGTRAASTARPGPDPLRGACGCAIARL